MSEVKNYNHVRASLYDEESNFDKGNRPFQELVLQNILSYNKNQNPKTFLELGIGTGFFTKVYLEKYPNIQSILVDGSAEMLEVSKQKYGNKNITYRQEILQKLVWSSIKKSDLVFSALTIHHLLDEEKISLYQNIYSNLNPDGVFIYFDQFITGNVEEDLRLEYLACKDIQYRILKKYELDYVIDELSIEKIIENDRKVKSGENDKEALISSTITELKKTGFNMVSIIYQEFRFFGIVAYK